MTKSLDADRALLVTENKRKPWCEVVLIDKYPSIYERYKTRLMSSNSLRSLIDEPALEDSLAGNAGKGLESKWIEHLEKNPAFAIWAKANPVPAQKVKDCQ